MTRTNIAAGALALLLLCPAVARTDVVLDWNVIAMNTLAGQPPFFQARFGAITQLAVFEAVNAITGGYEPYTGLVAAPASASAEAAAVAAAHTVLAHYFPGSAASLALERMNSLAAIPDGPAKDAGIAAGEAAAWAMIALRADDGSAPPEFFPPPSPEPGAWQLTPSCPAAGGVFYHWRNLTPFGIESTAQFRSDPPPPLTSPRYTRDYREVKEVGGVDSAERPADLTGVARFYNTLLAPALWNSVARRLAAARGVSLVRSARALALVNMAVSDGLASVMETKYHYNFWRPETAIREGHSDGNDRTEADHSFVPLLVTPCFPSYPSAHASASYAAREVLERVFTPRTEAISLSTPALPEMSFSYTKLKQITDDIDDARVYGGIHFRFDQEAGAEQGRRIGIYIHQHNLRPTHGPAAQIE
jgi:hypothetical protein